MNRMLLPALALLSAATPLVVDSALKGAALMSAALLGALLLWRASAAARHLVWLVAVLALLAVPLLSLVLPGWRVLPAWAVPPAVAATPAPEKTRSYTSYGSRETILPTPGAPQDSPTLTANPQPSPEPPAQAAATPAAVVPPAAAPVVLTPPVPWWRTALPFLWSAGCAALLLRLLGAHWLLRRAARRAQPVTDGPLAAALAAAASQLGSTQRVRLLVEEKRTIPVVWGVWRPRLLLPAEALTWDAGQLQSVLLHELGHIRRRDTLVQWLTQLACALHWFNPLVWLAAWRLHVERERACDDMVLASGVKPSAYAGHLLHVASQLSPARWTSACGLAMARKSALEGRLVAVLSGTRNRRGVTRLLMLSAAILGCVIAIPVAMLQAQSEAARNESAATAPQHKDARALYGIWQRHARTNGDVPGALIGELAAAVKVFIGYNPTWETVPKLNAMLPRLDATHDWKPADAIALLDEVAAVQDSPLQTAAEKTSAATIRQGEALPEKFAGVAWGETQPNGLRAAWVLESAAAEHRLGTALKARLLVQNTGNIPVMVRVPTWHQGPVKARDEASEAKSAELEVSSIEWTTLARLVPVRLGPGEFIEINAPGVGLGKDAGRGPWAGPRVGSNVLAQSGEELTLTHEAVPLDGSGVGMREDAPHLVGAGWWQAHIKARLARELPLPADAAERTHLLDRAVRELFATAPTAEETAAFTADQTPGAFDVLVQRLASRTDVAEFSGKLDTAPVKFRVLAADPAADNLPCVVLGPGEYPLSRGTSTSGAVTLKIVGRPVGDRRTNDAGLLFDATEATGKLPLDPHKLEIPDGWGTWAIVCRPGEGFFYLLHKGGVRKIDYGDPRKVTDTPAAGLPDRFREEVKRQWEIAGVSAESQAEILESAAITAPAPASGAPASDAGEPKHEYAQSLFRKWQARARTDGKIPGALIGQVAEQVENFIRQSPDTEEAKKLSGLRPRLIVSRDSAPAEAAALLDDVCAISTAPVSWADLPMEFNGYNHMKPGQPLPDSLTSAAWGTPAENGLRAAWVLEPLTGEVALGTVLKARVLFHNAGREPVIFRTETWHQSDPHTARDANGAEIAVTGTFYTGITPMTVYRLLPGEYCEVGGHGIAIGAGKYEDERSTGSVGAIIEAKAGDEVTLTHTVDAADGIRFTRPDDPKDADGLWKKQVAERVAEEAPLPAARADREKLIRRVMLDLTGVPPTPEDVEAFVADADPGALDRLVERILTRPRIEPWTGKLPTGGTKFRVTAADPDAGKTPRTAVAPGRYVLGDGVYLQVTQTTTADGKRTNKAQILFLPQDPKPSGIEQPRPYDIDFSNADAPYAFVWERGANTLWVTEISEGEPIRPWLPGSPERPGPQKVTVRAFDFSNPADVKLTHVSCSENGGDWSWGKIVPAAFHKSVLEALGERGKRLRDFKVLALQKAKAIILPEINMEGETLEAAIVQLYELSVKHTEDHKGLGFILAEKPSEATAKIYLHERNISLLDAVEKICKMTGYFYVAESDYVAESHWLLVTTDEKRTLQNKIFQCSRATAAKFDAVTGPAIDWGAIGLPSVDGAREGYFSRSGRLWVRNTTANLDALEALLSTDELPADAIVPAATVRPAVGKDTGSEKIQTTVRLVQSSELLQRLSASTPQTGGDRTLLGVFTPGETGNLLRDLRNDKNARIVEKADVATKGDDLIRIDGDGEFGFADSGVRVADGGSADTVHLMIGTLLEDSETHRPAFKQKEANSILLWDGQSAVVRLKPLTGKDRPWMALITCRKIDNSHPVEAMSQLPPLPDDAYAKPGVHCQKFREEDAKRPGGEVMGAVLEPTKPGDLNKEPLVLGLRTASDAQWRIGGTAKVGLVVRNRSDSDVKFSYTGRLENGISVVAVDETGKEHGAVIAQFRGELGFQQMLLPVAHVATIKQFTIRFDAEKRDVSEPHVAAFHLPPGKYTLRCKWNDARPDVAHEGEWTGELVNEELAFTLATAAPSADAPKTSDAGPQRKVDWSKFPHYSPPEIPFANPFVPENALLLAATPNKSPEDIERLRLMLLQAAVEKAVELRPLLKDEGLKRADSEYSGLAQAVAAYDYSVNGNKAALQKILDAMASDSKATAETAAWALVFVEEWELTLAAFNEHFGRFAVAEEYDLFWNARKFLYPDGYAKFFEKQLSTVNLDPESLRGMWKGSKDGVSVELRLGEKNQWEVRDADKVYKTEITAHTDVIGLRVHLSAPRDSNSWITYGSLEPGTAGTLRLSATQRSGVAINIVLNKEAEEKLKSGAMLQPETEQKLKWGAPVNGLRMALAWPPGLGEPRLGDAPRFHLVVQNVSDAAVRLTASESATNPRRLIFRKNGKHLSAIGDPTVLTGDWLLQPEAAVFFPVFAREEKLADGNTFSTVEEETVRLDPNLTLTAEMEIARAPDGAWTGTLATGGTRGSVDVIPPKHKDAQALYDAWVTAARSADGAIPGALIGQLADSVRVFIQNNPTWETAPQLSQMLPRFDSTHDWKAQDAVALLDELAALQSIPISMALDRETQGVIRTGSPLPADLVSAPWGEALSNGLRHAWLLEPRAAEYPLGTALKARVLIHNAGKDPVVFRARTWHQLKYTATGANGEEMPAESTRWTTRGILMTYRLAPGEYIELAGPGIGVGPKGDAEDGQQNRVGTWIEAKPGDEVTVVTSPLPLMDWGEEESLKLGGEPRWWLDHIKTRLSRHLPFPADEDSRLRLLYRIAMELFGTPVGDDINKAFVADASPAALEHVAELLFHRPEQKSWAGPLQSGVTKFRVTTALTGSTKPDDAAKPAADSGQGAMLRIFESGEISFQGKSLGLAELGAAARELPTPQVTVAAAKTAKFESVRAVLSVLWEAGISEIKINQASLHVTKVNVTPTGEVQLDGRRNVSLQDLTSLLEREKTTRGDLAVLLEGDGTRNYDVITKALDAMGKAGITQIGLVTTAREQAPGGAPGDEGPSSPVKKPADVPKPDKPKAGEAGKDKPAAAAPVARERQVGTDSMGIDGSAEVRGTPDNLDAPKQMQEPTPAVPSKGTQSEEKSNDNNSAEETAAAGLYLKGHRRLQKGSEWEKKGEFAAAYVEFKAARDLFDSVFQQDATWHPDIVDYRRKRVREDMDRVRQLEIKRRGAGGAPVLIPDEPTSEASAEPVPVRRVTPEDLLGFWRGTLNGENLMLSFHRPPVETDVQVDIYFGEATIGALASFTIAEDGGSVEMVQRSAGGGMKFGTLIPDATGKLKLELYGRQQGQQELILTRDVEQPATEPRQKEARELFELWKATANDDGAIPGTFIGKLATEVRAYVNAHPNFDSAAKLPKLLPRFVTSRDWSQAEAIALLDDVAYYATEPIQAYVAKAKLPSDALWRTKVELQDIPVKIETWSAAKNGLRIGIRVTEGVWRVGGKVRVELWLHNASEADITFKANPGRADVGLMVAAKDAGGEDHWAVGGNILLLAIPMQCTLPAGFAAKVKDFELAVDAPDNEDKTWMQPKFRDLPTGKYKLRCTWSDAAPGVSGVDDWTGELTTPELDFTLGALGAVNDESIGISPEEESARAKVQVDLSTADSIIGSLMRFDLAPDAAPLPQREFMGRVAGFDIAPDPVQVYERVFPGRDFENAMLEKDGKSDATSPPTAASQYVTVTIAKEGTLSYERTAVTLAGLKDTAGQNAKKWFTIEADKEVPYARAVEVLETLKAAGVEHITFRDARMGDGRYRVANRTGNYSFDEAHKFSICMPPGRKQWFTVLWPAKEGKPARRLKYYPEADAGTRSQWAVVWEPGTNVLWWADDSWVGRMNVADPDQVMVSREARLGDFSAEFALPEEVKTAFRGLGLAVGKLGQSGPGGALRAASKEVLAAEAMEPR